MAGITGEQLPKTRASEFLKKVRLLCTQTAKKIKG
jgi:hypothetical protein